MSNGSGGCATSGCLGVLTGMAAGAASWTLADAARRTCGSYPEHGWWGLHPGAVELPAAMAAGTLTAVLALGLAQLPLRRRKLTARRTATVRALAVLVALALLTWAHFAWWGTVPFPGTSSNSGRCAYDNIPGWWPAWLPA